MKKGEKIVVILGPTSSGKSEVAIKLAKKYNGEIISADSRQIYRNMNIGTGKIARDFSSLKSKIKNQKSKYFIYYSSSIPHYMIDIVSPKTDYNVAKFKKQAEKIIDDILKRGKLPIICGGTGFWIKAIVDNVAFPAVRPNKVLRNQLNNKSAEVLFKMLRKLDPERAKNIDQHNKVRLIRAIEICKVVGFVPRYKIQDTRYKFLQIGIKLSKEKLQKNIQKRLGARFKQGMIEEVRDLHYKKGVSWKKLESFGLEYKLIALYLQKKLIKKEMNEKLLQEIKNYAKRQMTWFRKDKRTKWLKNCGDIKKVITKFIKE